MSRCVSLNQARAKASASCLGFARKRRAIFSYAGSKRSARSVVSIEVARPAPVAPFDFHCCAPAGLFVSSHSWPNRSEEHTSELQSRRDLVCRLLLEKKKKQNK